MGSELQDNNVTVRTILTDEDAHLVNKETITEGEMKWLNEHLKIIKEKIITKAGQEANNNASDKPKIKPMNISDTTKLYAPGQEILDYNYFYLKRLLDPITGLTLISALLTILFGFLGLYADKGNSQSWLDIAKIFAGAVVGSAGAAAISGARNK